MILKGTKFIKENGVILIVDDEIGDDIHFHEQHYMKPRVVNKDIFHSMCTIHQDIKVDEVVLFQAYEDRKPVQGRVKRIGTQAELGMFTLDENDRRIFYELETVGERHNHVFTKTTQRWIKKIT